MDSFSEKKVILITGAAQRIGATIARHLHAFGYNIAIHYRNSELPARKIAAELNNIRKDSAFLVAGDLSKAKTCVEVVQKTYAWSNRLDALINNASSFYPTPIGSVQESHWEDLINSNLTSTFFLIQAAVPFLRTTRGSIVNLSDARWSRPLPQFSVYAAAKAGIIAITRSLALELAPAVRINVVAPGAIGFPENNSIELPKEAYSHIPMKQKGCPQDIARATAFLLEETYITGHVLTIDGGMSIVSV